MTTGISINNSFIVKDNVCVCNVAILVYPSCIITLEQVRNRNLKGSIATESPVLNCKGLS